MDFELYEKADAIIAAIKESDEYHDLKRAMVKFETEALLKAKVDAFTRTKAKYEGVCKYGKHHPDFESVSKDLIEAKSALYSDQAYRDYQTALTKINERLRELSKAIEATLQECLINQSQSCHKG